MLVDSTDSVLDFGPVAALPGDGASLLVWGVAPRSRTGVTGTGIGLSNIEIAIADRGQGFSAPVELVGHQVSGFSTPQIAAFGSDTAIAWTGGSRARLNVQIAVQRPDAE